MPEDATGGIDARRRANARMRENDQKKGRRDQGHSRRRLENKNRRTANTRNDEGAMEASGVSTGPAGPLLRVHRARVLARWVTKRAREALREWSSGMETSREHNATRPEAEGVLGDTGAMADLKDVVGQKGTNTTGRAVLRMEADAWYPGGPAVGADMRREVIAGGGEVVTGSGSKAPKVELVFGAERVECEEDWYER